jgi:molybdate transport system permease protein
MGDPEVLQALRLSLQVGLWCTVLGLPPALLLGWVLARHPFRAKPIVSAAVLAPMVLPPVVTGLLLLQLLGRSSFLGQGLLALGLRVPFTLLGAVVAAGVVGLPLYVLVVRGAFEAVDPRYEEVARTLGEPPHRTFVRVTLPLALPGIAAGAVLAFARALGEFGATVVLAGNVEGRTRTLALAVYSLLDTPGGEERIGVLVAASIGLSVVALVIYEGLVRYQRRRLELDGGR